MEAADLLRLCHTVPLEVVSLGGLLFLLFNREFNSKVLFDEIPRQSHHFYSDVIQCFVALGGKGYDPEKADYSDFKAWLQCYYVDGMKSIRDHNGRTMWFKVSSSENPIILLRIFYLTEANAYFSNCRETQVHWCRMVRTVIICIHKTESLTKLMPDLSHNRFKVTKGKKEGKKR